MFSLPTSAKHVRAWVRNLKIQVQKTAPRCQLVHRTSKSEGVKCDVLKFPGCQAPLAPVLTQWMQKKCFECSKKS